MDRRRAGGGEAARRAFRLVASLRDTSRPGYLQVLRPGFPLQLFQQHSLFWLQSPPATVQPPPPPPSTSVQL